MRPIGIYVLLICLSGAASVSGQVIAPDSLARLFDYDGTAALDVRDSVVVTLEGVKVIDVTYASPKQGRVTAYLVVPENAGRHPAVVFGHWGYGTRTEFLPEAIAYARAGVVSLLVDYPWVRPGLWRRNVDNFANPEVDREIYIQAVVDLRRGLDLLCSREDVDSSRLAYVGHSYGAQWGAILTAIDKRLKAAVLIGGTPSLGEIFEKSDDPDMVGLRQALGEEALKMYLNVASTLDGVVYVPYSAPVPLLFQFANFDRYFGAESMKRYAAAAATEKEVLWYNTGHELNDPKALLDRAEFLSKKLGLPEIREVALPCAKERH